jgi:hypothetical protein
MTIASASGSKIAVNKLLCISVYSRN